MRTMEASSYVCPNCGAAMEFNSDAQKMVCSHCNHMMTVEELQEYYDRIDEAFPEEEDSVYGEFEMEERNGDFKVYRCQGCGAEILADEHTAAAFCTFCGRPSLFEDRLTGALLPEYVIPFKIKKEAAAEIYKKWTKRGLLTPSILKSQFTIDRITGIYVPFWLYDFNADIKMRARCTNVRRKVSGDYEYVYTDYFIVDREVETEYRKIPADASEKMPDDIMDKLEPFMYNELEPFEMPYLSGYYAEKYNYKSEEMALRVENRVKKYIYEAARNTITGYSTVNVTNKQIQLGRKKASYALFPVWVLNYTYKGQNYLFTLNGQTGKIVADRPISKSKGAIWFSAITTVSFTILFLAGRLLGW